MKSIQKGKESVIQSKRIFMDRQRGYMGMSTAKQSSWLLISLHPDMFETRFKENAYQEDYKSHSWMPRSSAIIKLPLDSEVQVITWTQRSFNY